MTPVLLLIPGMLNPPRVFDAALQHAGLKADVRVLDVTGPADIPAMAAAGWAQVADVPDTRPLLLAGYSMGGYVALKMLADAARPVQALGLIASSARADSGEGAALRQRAIATIERDFERYLFSLLGFLLSKESQADADFVARVRADMRAVGAQAAIRQQRAAATRGDHRELLRTLAQPVEVLCGGADTVTPPHLSQEIATLAPRARLQVVEGAGHLLPYEHPAAVAAALQRLLTHGVPST